MLATLAEGADVTHQANVTNAIPTVSGVVLNHGNAITLTANTTTTVDLNFTVSDNNGCGDVFFSGARVARVFRSGVSSSCTAFGVTATSTLNCYALVSATDFTDNCPSATSSQVSANVTGTVQIYYFAEATDASSSFPTENWVAQVGARDGSNATGTAVSSGVELNTLLALRTATGTLNYGLLSPGATTTGDYSVSVVSAGNSSSSLRVSGVDLIDGGGHSIPVGNQHYATGTFTFGGTEQVLSGVANSVAGFLISRPPLTSWATTTAISGSSDLVGVASTEKNVYKIGGGVSDATTSVQFASFAPVTPGFLGGWNDTTAFPTTVQGGVAFANNNYLYYFGGTAGGSATSTVRFAPINSTGSIGAWATTTPMPLANTEFAGAIYNGYVYVLGGSNAAVAFAPINSTGSIGAWTTTTPMSSNEKRVGVAAYNGYLYAIGGTASGIAADATSSAFYARINSTGSIGTWQNGASLPEARFSHGTYVNNGLVYVAGGHAGIGVNTTTVNFAPLAADGALGPWSTTTPLSSAKITFGTTAANGYLYAIGGFTDNTVLYAPLASRNVYWGIQTPGGNPAGTYSGITTYTAVFSP